MLEDAQHGPNGAEQTGQAQPAAEGAAGPSAAAQDSWAGIEDWSPTEPPPPVQRECAECGRVFDAPGSAQAARRYCGPACSRAADAEKRRIRRLAQRQKAAQAASAPQEAAGQGQRGR